MLTFQQYITENHDKNLTWFIPNSFAQITLPPWAVSGLIFLSKPSLGPNKKNRIADCLAYTHFMVNFAFIPKVKHWLSSRYPQIVGKKILNEENEVLSSGSQVMIITSC